jgi:hypothetical protein
MVRDRPVPHQIGADGSGVGAPARREDAVEIASARLQALGLGMAHQQQTAHEVPAFFRTRIAISTLTNDLKMMIRFARNIIQPLVTNDYFGTRQSHCGDAFGNPA